MSNELGFNLNAEYCENGSGQYWSQAWFKTRALGPRRIQSYLGRKLPNENLIDAATKDIPQILKRYVGAVSVLRLCEGASHKRRPQLERYITFVIAKDLQAARLPVHEDNYNHVKDGWGSVQIDMPGARRLQQVVFPPVTPGERQSQPIKEVIPVGVFAATYDLYVALRGLEQITEPTSLMLENEK